MIEHINLRTYVKQCSKNIDKTPMYHYLKIVKYANLQDSVLTYDKDLGFEARDNGVINRLKPAMIMVLDVDENENFQVVSKRLAEEELHRMETNGDLSEFEKIVREKI